MLYMYTFGGVGMYQEGANVPMKEIQISSNNEETWGKYCPYTRFLSINMYLWSLLNRLCIIVKAFSLKKQYL